MTEINTIKKDTDLSKTKKILFGWDFVLNGRPYDVWCIPGFCHSIGGRLCINELWACPSDEKPTYENLIEFSGEAPAWGIRVEERNHAKTKWDATRVRHNTRAVITRNGKPFYEFFVNGFEYALAKAQKELCDIQEHPVCFAMRDWRSEVLQRKVLYNNQPGTITRVSIPDFYVWIEPGESDGFKCPPWWSNNDWEEYKDGLYVPILSEGIWWFSA